MNCFQIVFLYRSLTTNFKNDGTVDMLWIAFKLYFYIGLWQLFSLCASACEVVNCFQIVFLYRSLTTGIGNNESAAQLWIAFKLYFYIGLWQLGLIDQGLALRCELLSNCIFISVFDNNVQFNRYLFIVVNCFQIVFLYRSLTTKNRNYSEIH